MTRYAVLATDAVTPAYAVWAPVVARVWRQLGWEPLLVLHNEHWDATPWAREVRRELAEFPAMVKIPTCPPLGVPNTMRCSRLVAACWTGLSDDDVLMTTDVDMVPVSTTFFVPLPSEAFVLRSLYQARLTPPYTYFSASDMEPVAFHFAMCYCGATAARWRLLFPEIVIGDAGQSLLPIIAGRRDHPENDEKVLSYRLLSAWPSPTVEEAPGQWRRGGLRMTDPMVVPCLSELYPNIPRGLAIHGEGGCREGMPAAGCIDWIPTRFEGGSTPWADVQAVGRIHPSLQEWVEEYVAKMKELL